MIGLGRRPPSPGRRAIRLLAAAALFAGCDSRGPAVVYDLAARVPVADRASAAFEVVLFGTPAAERHQAEGFHAWAGGDGDRYVWARREVEVALFWGTSSERLAVADLAPFPGVAEQSVEVLLNGEPVAGFELNDYRHRYRVPLPAAAQRVGDNRLRFEFARTGSQADLDSGSDDRGQVAAAFYALTVASADAPGLEDLLRREAPSPFSSLDERAVPGFAQIGPSRVRFALKLPERAELRFTPRLHPAARAAEAGVAIETEAGTGRELWRASLEPGTAPDEVAVPLPGRAGDVVGLSLSVEGGAGRRMAWVEWRGPRVLGLTPDFDPERQESAREAADWLRDRLADANVLLVVLDAARARQLGCYGYGRATTPEIDRIASEGVVFDRATTPAVYTLGAMSALWTSQHPDRHRTATSFSARLPRDRLTLAELLAARGVATAGFVANAVAGRAFGFHRGFGEFHEVYRAGGSDASVFRDPLPRFWREVAGRFFAYVHFREPHFPYDPPAPFDTAFGPDGPIAGPARSDMAWVTDVNQGRRELSPEERAHLVRLYDGNLAYADRELGRIRRDLERSGLWERTVVIVTADHGEALHERGWIGHNVELYETSVRVPLIVRFPAGAGPAGIRIAELADLTDLAPTVADLFGALGAGGSAESFEGRSLLPVIAGGAGKPEVLSRTVWDRPRYALSDRRHKLVLDTRDGSEQLYDLAADPAETRSLAAARPLLAAYLREQLQMWLARLARPERASGQVAPTQEQCENLVALGYLSGKCE